VCRSVDNPYGPSGHRKIERNALGPTPFNLRRFRGQARSSSIMPRRRRAAKESEPRALWRAIREHVSAYEKAATTSYDTACLWRRCITLGQPKIGCPPPCNCAAIRHSTVDAPGRPHRCESRFACASRTNCDTLPISIGCTSCAALSFSRLRIPFEAVR
jgi:hypothetical protein